MRIIKPGKIELPKEIQFDCEYCGCVFACELNELSTEQMEVMGLERKRTCYFTAQCPCCRNTVVTITKSYF